MKKHIPNALTATRVILFAPLLTWLTLTQQWTLALICFSVGFATNISDGYLARRWNVCSKLGADILQPVCDLIFTATAVTLLIITGHWPFWIGVLLLIIAGVLQLISFLADKMPGNQMIRELKRHQSYIHPLYSAAVMFVALMAYMFVEDGAANPYEAGGWHVYFVYMTILALALNYGYVHRLVKTSLVRA